MPRIATRPSWLSQRCAVDAHTEPGACCVEIRYIVMSEEQIDSILEDLVSDGRLEGEKWWRDGRWKTFEVIHPDV